MDKGLTSGSFLISSILLMIGGGAGLVLGLKVGSFEPSASEV